MKPIGILILPLLIAPAASLHGAADILRIHVSPTGDDKADGISPERPLRTLAGARDRIRTLKSESAIPDGGVRVEIRGGRYVLDEPLRFGPGDSGQPGAPILYQNADDSTVEIIGGRALVASDWSPVRDPAMRKRLDASAVEKIRQVSIDQLGLKHAGPFPAKFDDGGGLFELFWNGRRLPLSRWPNEGWTTMKSAVVNGDSKTPGVFEYRGDRPSRWLANRDIWLKGQWRVAWEEPALRVASIDPSTSRITLAAAISLGIGNKYTRPAGNGKEPWCALNLPEEIDTPGEWAVDFSTRTLYVWPPEGKGELIVSQLEKPMVLAEGVQHLGISGLRFAFSLGDGVVASGVDSFSLTGCTLSNLGGTGAVIDGYRSRVESCDMFDLGAGCVMISGGDHLKLVPSGNVVINNHLHHYGRKKAMYSAAVDVGFGGAPNAANHKVAVGVRVAHNLIHHGPRDAILVSGQDHVFELNDIHRCGYASDDLGAFYSWLDWTIRGVVIRHNHIHDTIGGVNPDDGASGSLVYGNIFSGPRTGVWIASGPDHTVTHNIFVKYEGPVIGVDDRGVSRGYATNKKLIDPVLAVRPTEAPWSKRFPEMATLLQDRPELPLRMKFTRNVIVIQKGEPVILKMNAKNKADPALFEQSGNFVTAEDPGFVDAANGNLALKPDSQVYQKIPGFPEIPFGKIGLYPDKHRKSLPPVGESRKPGVNPMHQSDPETHFGT